MRQGGIAERACAVRLAVGVDTEDPNEATVRLGSHGCIAVYVRYLRFAYGGDAHKCRVRSGPWDSAVPGPDLRGARTRDQWVEGMMSVARVGLHRFCDACNGSPSTDLDGDIPQAALPSPGAIACSWGAPSCLAGLVDPTANRRRHST